MNFCLYDWYDIPSWILLVLTVLSQTNKLGLSFSSAKELRSRAEILPSGPEWRSQTLTMDGYQTKDPITLYYRDSLECAEFLYRHPLLLNHIDLLPKKVTKVSDPNIRVFSEWTTGECAWALQVNIYINICEMQTKKVHRINYHPERHSWVQYYRLIRPMFQYYLAIESHTRCCSVSPISKWTFA
jgi:hypothetical protein